MKKFFFLVAMACALHGAAKDDPKYPVSTIPEEMKKGMYGVIRDSEERFEINALNSSTHYFRFAITILNPNGKRLASLSVGYDKITTIKSFKGTAYDATGEVIKKLKQSEIYDQSATDAGTLFSDDRVKSANLSQSTYPYTVEFEYEVQIKSLYSIPNFTLYDDDEVSTVKTSFTLIYPKELPPRYKLNQIKEPEKSKLENGKEVLTWKFENIMPEKFERFSPDLVKIVPNIITAPADFEYDGFAGKMDSWQNFGKWQIKLNEGRGELPELTKSHVREITKQAKTTEEKARILYDYLQSKTRYVGVQLGIGGFQPFDAKVVDQTGYGDCKALSNYMVALLRVVDVKAYYTMIRSGDDAAETDAQFPNDPFNHIIVGVPDRQDTIWLECTSQVNPFGYLGTSTGDRYALMVTEEGGKLVRTISYKAEQNVQSRTANVFIDLNGDGKAKVKTTYSGLQYENGGLGYISGGDDQRKWVQNSTQIPAFDINTFSIRKVKDKIPQAIVDLDLTLKRYATVSGKRIFVTPNLMNRSTYIPEKLEKRKTNVVRRSDYIDLDTVHYSLPEGIYPEFLPAPVSIKSRFGEYEASYKIDDKGLTYFRRVRMKKGEFPPESYSELIDFYRSISKADNAKLVFVSKT